MSVAIDEKIDVDIKRKKPRKYNIICLDNDITSFDEVVTILVSSFNMSTSVASEITMKVDREGRAIVNPKPLSKEIAQALLDKVNKVKYNMASILYYRKEAILALKFQIKPQ